METYYYVYKITNKVNGKIYIGVHKTNDLNDRYFGSGKYLKQAIKKYGIENFEKEILQFCLSKEEMYGTERLLVNEEFVKRKDTYNTRVGGGGDWSHVNKHSNIQKQKNILSQHKQKFLRETDKEWNARRIGNMKVAQQKSWLDGTRTVNPNFTYAFLGKSHTEEAKRKTGDANKKLVGCKNSQYGTKWVTDGVIEKKISVNDVLDSGWNFGRLRK